MRTKFTKGQKLTGSGLNRECKAVTMKVKFVEYLSEPRVYPRADGSGETRLDCIVIDGQCRVMSDSRSLRA